MATNKSQQVKIVPDNYTAVTPWIISHSTERMIDFLKSVFNAEEIPNSKIRNAEGNIIHVVVKIRDAMVMLFDSREGWGPTPAFLNLYVDDVEKTYAKFLQMGAIPVTEVTPLWFGEKVCRILDPFGNLLWINQRIEEFDFSNLGEVTRRGSTEEAITGIAYIQKSLDEALKQQKAFFDKV